MRNNPTSPSDNAPETCWMAKMGTPGDQDPPTTDDVFELLEHLLGSSAIRTNARARPVAFDVLSDKVMWLFDPLREGPLFRRVEASDVKPGTLVVHCDAELLGRLVKNDGFVLGEEDTAWFDGDIEHLLPIADALEQGTKAAGIRPRKGK